MSTKNIFIASLTLLTLLFPIGCDRIENAIDKTDDAGNIGNIVFSSTPHAWSTDPYVINFANWQDDTLTVNVSYGGGCEIHEVTLVADDQFDERFLESSPVGLRIWLDHNANGDRCKAWITEDYHFDLTPIKEVYQEAYGTETGAIYLFWADRSGEEPPFDVYYEF